LIRGVIATATLIVGAAACSPDERASEARSVLLITLDTVRADRLSSYGYATSTTPNIDAIGQRGVRFEYAFSTSCRTAPSHASILTGLYPSFNSIDTENSRFKLGRRFSTLAELVRNEGIQTAAVVGNPVLSRDLGLAQGFHSYDDRFPGRVLNRPYSEKTAEVAADAAIAQLETFGDRPFFFWLHLQDPHGPYTPPDRFAATTKASDLTDEVLEAGEDLSGLGAIPQYQILGAERRLAEYSRLYDAELRYLDHELGRVLDALDSLRLANRTLVVLTADHGEAFGEDGYYLAHGHGLSLDQTRVPLLIAGPGVRTGQVHDGAVSNLDVFATVLDFMGIVDVDRQQSRSLLPIVTGAGEAHDRIGYAESVTQRAVFMGDRYIRKDRHPPSDEQFWRSKNPYTGAPYVSLRGARSNTLSPGVKSEQPVGSEDGPLISELANFAEEADRMRAAIASSRDRRVLSEQEREGLRALGYLE
jgi:arylsulfatase A-like enzyme